MLIQFFKTSRPTHGVMLASLIIDEVDVVSAYLERCGARPALEQINAKDAPKTA